MINFPASPTDGQQYTYADRSWQWRPAPIWLRPFMRLARFDGWASFWNRAYIMPGHEDDQRLIRHELCHLRQIERDGRVLFARTKERGTVYWQPKFHHTQLQIQEW